MNISKTFLTQNHFPIVPCSTFTSSFPFFTEASNQSKDCPNADLFQGDCKEKEVWSSSLKPTVAFEANQDSDWSKMKILLSALKLEKYNLEQKKRSLFIYM